IPLPRSKTRVRTQGNRVTPSEFRPQFASSFQAFRGDGRSLIEIEPESFDQFGQVGPLAHSRWLYDKGIGPQFIGPLNIQTMSRRGKNDHRQTSQLRLILQPLQD